MDHALIFMVCIYGIWSGFEIKIWKIDMQSKILFIIF